MTWIAQGIVIWEGLRVAQSVLRGMVEEMLRLESVQARVGFISGQGLGQTAQEFAQAARYGITPAQAGPGAITAAQLRLGAADQQRAAHIALVFGADQYNNALQELYQTQIVSTAAGVKKVQVMDCLATAFKTAPGDVESYFDALQKGILISSYLGLSAEQAAIAILNISKATEQAPEATATTLQYAIQRLARPEIQERVSKYGIEAGTPAQMLREVAAEVDRLVSSGNTERARRLLEEITGGLQGPQRLLQLQVAFQTLNDAFRAGQQPLGDYNDFLKGVTDTGVTAFARLDAAARADLITLGMTAQQTNTLGLIGQTILYGGIGLPFGKSPIPSALKLLEGPAGGIADFLDTASQARTFEQQTGKQAYLNQGGALGLGGMPVLIMNPEFKRWLDNANNPIAMERSWAADAARWQAQADFYNPPPGKGQLTFPEPPEFGGFQTFPKGQDWDQFRSLVRKYETQIQAEVPGYTLDRQQVAFWDETTKHYRTLIGDTNAIRFATEEQRKLMAEQITGVFNIPDSGRALVAFYALQQGYVPRDRADALASGAGSFPKAKEISDPITTAVYTVNDTLMTFGDIFGAARNAYGGDKQPGGIPKVTDGVDVYSQYLPVIEEGASKGRQEMQRRQNFTRRMLPEDALFSKIQREQDELIAAEGLGGSRSDTPMRSRRSTAQRAQQMSIPITINSRIVINVDGRRIQQMINRQTYQQFSQIAGGAGVAAGSSVL